MTPATLTVLVVDDDDESLSLVSALVRAKGYRVATAHDGREALQTFEREAPQLVITDQMMPELDGAGFLAAIKKQNPLVPVLVMSVIDSVDRAVELLRSGADDYLIKPVDPPRLYNRLEHHLKQLALQQDVEQLEQVLELAFELGEDFVLGPSVSMRRLLAKIPAMAKTDANIVIYGESGTGKELVARSIHRASKRGTGQLVSVSCASIPDGLWERELFGHVKGAFSDAGGGAPGVIAAAAGGTLFLDEVGEIPLSMQAKLLRFLQEREYRPVGSTETKRADVRVIAATHRDLAKRAKDGLFRQDLFYRLNVLTLTVPPLVERKEDIPQLASGFLRRYAASFDKPVVGFSPIALQKLLSYDFPGNVRELENVVQQALISAQYSVICADDVGVGDTKLQELEPRETAAIETPRIKPPSTGKRAAADDGAPMSKPYNEAKLAVVEQFERNYVTTLLEQHDGNISQAAKSAGLPRKSLARIMSRHQILGGPHGTGGRPGRPPTGGTCAADSEPK
jgi:DNA-binding NtrC family response regulator